MNGKLMWRTVMSILTIFIAALLVRECRDIKNTHDAVIRLESKDKK